MTKVPTDARRTLLAWLLLLAAAGCATPSQRLTAHRLNLLPVSLEDLGGMGLGGFRSPAKWEQVGGLYLLEPYRPGAVPVVLTHGLLSDPATWEKMHARLTADPVVAGRCQFWAFAYPTGPSYLHAAADLREELSRVRQTLDPTGTDAALSQAVLVGHSMGGIVSRLQVVSSGEAVWRTLAGDRASLDDLDAESRAEFGRLTLFAPQPGVTRAVYIAAPHGGSAEARGRLGRLGRRLVMFPDSVLRGYEKFRTSPTGELMRLPARPPTSIEHLDPCNPVLRAVRGLPTSPLVRTHTILGTGSDTAGRDGDGYVTARSATLPDADSTFAYEADHTDVHRKLTGTLEVRRILREHVAALPPPASSPAAASPYFAELHAPAAGDQKKPPARRQPHRVVAGQVDLPPVRR